MEFDLNDETLNVLRGKCCNVYPATRGAEIYHLLDMEGNSILSGSIKEVMEAYDKREKEYRSKDKHSF